MSTSIKIAPPNSLLVVSDPHGGTPPRITKGRRIWSTSSCIIVGCQAFMDGETEVTLGEAHEVDPGIRPTFDDMLSTPNYAVAVMTVEGEAVILRNLSATTTRVRIWVNHPSEPDEIVIGMG